MGRSLPSPYRAMHVGRKSPAKQRSSPAPKRKSCLPRRRSRSPAPLEQSDSKTSFQWREELESLVTEFAGPRGFDKRCLHNDGPGGDTYPDALCWRRCSQLPRLRPFTRRVRAGPLDSALRPLDPLACDSVLRQMLAKMGAGVLNCRLARSRHSEPTRRGIFVGGGIHPPAGLVVCNSALRQPVAQRLGAGALHLRRLYRSRISEPARCSLVVGVGIGTVSGCHFLSARGACSRACRNQALWAHQSHDGRL